MQKPCNKCDLASSYTYKSGKTRYYPHIFGDYRQVCCDCEKHKKYEEYLESRRKYREGESVKGLDEYFSLIENGETLFYWRGDIRHYRVLESLQFRTFVDLIRRGSIYRAIKK